MTETPSQKPTRCGFRQERGSTHTARTMMLAELRELLSYVDRPDAGKVAYYRAIAEDNCLGKRSSKTRLLTYRHLSDLYALDPSLILFRALLYFWHRDPCGQPLLALLCALGHVIPADSLYFDATDKLLQSRLLPRKVHEKTISWNMGSEDERLMARACGLVFLINKLGHSNTEIGIRATIDALADLLVENLAQGSSALRSKLPGLLDACELLMKVGNEYRIQTEESAAWTDELQSQRAILANEAHRIEADRDDRIRKKFGELVRKLSLTQGRSKVTRDMVTVFNARLPADADEQICVWVRDGWSLDANAVRADARQAGQHSPTIFVFVPKRSADDLRRYLIDYKAASE